MDGENVSRYSYEGKEYDDVIGQYDFHFRGYKSEWGKFVQPDTLIANVYNPQFLNRYSFENNNPYKNVDPDGHQGYEAIGAMLGPYGVAAVIVALLAYYIIVTRHAAKEAEKLEAQEEAQKNKQISTDTRIEAVKDTADKATEATQETKTTESQPQVRELEVEFDWEKEREKAGLSKIKDDKMKEQLESAQETQQKQEKSDGKTSTTYGSDGGGKGIRDYRGAFYRRLVKRLKRIWRSRRSSRSSK